MVVSVPTTPAKTDLKAQFSITLSTISSCGVLITFGSPTDGTNGGLCFLASWTAGMIELSGICSLGNAKFWCLSSLERSAMLDSPIQSAPDSQGQNKTRKSGFTDVSLRKSSKYGVPNISARIHANAGGHKDVCDRLCSHNTCSGKNSLDVEFPMV